jgi:hypothetical protein
MQPLFHAAATHARDSIREHGLRAPGESGFVNWPGKSNGVSVYLLATVEQARDWIDYMHGCRFHWESFDIWQTDTDGLDVVDDPNMPDGYDSFRCPQTICPERLQLVEQISYDERGFLSSTTPLPASVAA